MIKDTHIEQPPLSITEEATMDATAQKTRYGVTGVMSYIVVLRDDQWDKLRQIVREEIRDAMENPHEPRTTSFMCAT